MAIMSSMLLGSLAIVAGVVGGVVGGVGAYQQAQAQEDIANWQAEQEQINADAAQQQAEVAAQAREADARQQEMMEREKNAKIKAQNRANAGVQGLDNTGTALLYNIDVARQMELNALEVRRQGINDAAMIRWQGDMGVYNHSVAAEGYSAQAANASAAKGWNTTGSTISGASSGLSLVSGTNSLIKGK